MIPFASQRALGQDLATHLMNEEDNEYMEVAEVRGAIAQDLHGAFAEWEAQAHALTKCDNYLYSLSINPDERQRRLTREEYLAYIDAVEKKLGLDGQPRAVAFHIKNEREHCHVVWSRIDAGQGKAVHMPFDHDKLMMVTREFARERGLTLPGGYYKDKDRHRAQATLYEQRQQNITGLTQEQRKAAVTAAWKQSDNAQAFVRALEEKGYILARGDKRPYVLVDLYGGMNALAKLIDDRQVRTKDIRARLESEFPPESLPSVEEAKALAAEHRKAREDFAKANFKAEELTRLKERQAERRRKIETDVAKEERRQAGEFRDLRDRHRRERDEARAMYLAEVRRIRADRQEREPKGFPGFLSRFTGITHIREMIQRQRDKKLYDTFIEGRLDLRERHEGEERALQHRHHLQNLDLDRRLRALGQIEERERKSLETKKLAQQRSKQRGSHEHMPAIRLELKPRGRPAAPYKAKNRYISEHREKTKRKLPKAEFTEKESRLSLTEEFDRAAGEGRSGEGSGSAAGELNPVAETTIRREKAQKEASNKDGSSERMDEFNRVAGETASASKEFNRAAEAQQSAGTGSEDASAPEQFTEEKTSRRRRRKRRRDRKEESEISQKHLGNNPESQEPPSGKKPRRPRRPRKRDRERDRGM